MSIFDLKGGGSDSNVWNYSDNSKANYTEFIQGTCVEISNPQARDFNTGKPAFWDDGNPKRNLKVTLLQNDGAEISWIFSPKSDAADACKAALDPNDTRAKVNIEELLGKMLTISTEPGSYNARNHRPWTVVVHGDGQINMVRGINDFTKQPAQQQQPAPQQQAPAQQAPTALQFAMNQAQQAVAQQNFQQANAAPPVNQVPVSAYGNDPTGGLYSVDIPF